MSTEEAHRRLQAALDRLEAAARRLADRRPPAADADAEIAALRDERDRLSAALDKTEADRARLERTSRAASDRLEAAAARLKTTIGG